MANKFFIFWKRTSVRFVLMLILFGVGTLLSMRLFERMLLNQVEAVTEAANVAFTRLFVNEAWEELGMVFKTLPLPLSEELRRA